MTKYSIEQLNTNNKFLTKDTKIEFILKDSKTSNLIQEADIISSLASDIVKKHQTPKNLIQIEEKQM